MGLGAVVKGAWERLAGTEAGAQAEVQARGAEHGSRRTQALPSVFLPMGGRTGAAAEMAMPKRTPANLRRFAETPVARRAINCVKDKIASMDWQVRVRRGYDPATVEDCAARLNALRLCLEEPNGADSFRTLWEQVIEDVLVGGFGSVEMESTGDAERPFRLWAVDGATIEVDPSWDGDASKPRYAQMVRSGFNGAGLLEGYGTGERVALRDDELMYIRLNPRSYTAFGLGRLEVAFESIHQFLGAHRYAGRLASNGVVQYCLWLDEATPEQQDRLIRYWQDEVEGTGRVPVLSSEKKPEVLRFAQGTDADLRLAWQEFLIRMIANAFDLPAMLLGLQSDVNKSTAAELADEAFQSAVVPVAKLLAEHVTRDLFAKKLGWREFEFCFNELEGRSEGSEVSVQVELLKAGVLTVDEVRAMRGLLPLSMAPESMVETPELAME
jgi:phage portal protein BeeE